MHRPWRHVVERDVETAVLLLQLLGGALALGDVLVGADLVAVLERLVADRDQAAIGETAHHRRLAVLPVREPPLEILQHLLRGLVGRSVDAVLLSEADQIDKRGARRHRLRPQAVQFEEALVVHDHAPVLVEHAQPVRHVLQRGVEAAVLLAQLLGRVLALGDVLEGADPAAVRHLLMAHMEKPPLDDNSPFDDAVLALGPHAA